MACSRQSVVGYGQTLKEAEHVGKQRDFKQEYFLFWSAGGDRMGAGATLGGSE